MLDASEAPTDSTRAEVLVIGEALVDVVRQGEESVEYPGGSPANIAFGLARLGVPTRLLTQLGTDERGSAVAAHLRGGGVEIDPSSFADAPTSTAIATIGLTGAATYEFNLTWDIAPEAFVGAPRAIHLGSVASFLEPGASKVRAILDGTSGIVTFDPNIRPQLVGDHSAAVRVFEATASTATAVKLSDEDAEWLYPDRSVDETLSHILSLGPVLAVATLGGSGSLLMTSAASTAVPAQPAKVVDTIGAGDSYMSALISSLLGLEAATLANLSAADLEQLGHTSSVAAAITVSRAGAFPPDLRELRTAGG